MNVQSRGRRPARSHRRRLGAIMQAGRRPFSALAGLALLALGPATNSSMAGQQKPATEPGPAHFDPRRPPARELETRVPDGFTLAAVGDLIPTRPLAQTLLADPGFAAIVRILRD